MKKQLSKRQITVKSARPNNTKRKRLKPKPRHVFRTSQDARDQRIEFRVSLAEKQVIEKAVSLSSLSITDLTRQTLLEASTQIISEKEGLFTSKETRNHFFSVLDNPPPANAALKQAFKLHSEKVKTLENAWVSKTGLKKPWP